MMHALYELKDKLMTELEERSKKDELSVGSLDIIDKLAHAIKNLCKVIDMCEDDEHYDSDKRGSYRMSRRGRSYDDGTSERMSRRGSYRGEYSRHYGKEAMIEHLEKLADEAADESIRKSIERCISQMETA